MKLRLNSFSRLKLKDRAKAIVAAPAEAAALAVAYAKAEPSVRRCVETVYPPRDMVICRKYEAAKIDDCIKLQFPAGDVHQFDFTKGTGPLVVKLTYSGKIYDADKETADAVMVWRQAHDAHKAAVKAKLADYGAVIDVSRTLEEVAEIWPEAEQMRAQCEPRAISIISPDIIARVRSDIVSRANL